MTTRCLRTADDFRRITVEYAARGRRPRRGLPRGGRARRRSSPQLGVDLGRDLRRVRRGRRRGAGPPRRHREVHARPVPRPRPRRSPRSAPASSVRYRDRGVVGLGIGGPEKDRSIEPYRKAFEIARAGGLGVVPHSGEADGPASMREVLTLDPDRIRHGIRAVEDPELLAEIVERGLVLDVCPDVERAHRRGAVPRRAPVAAAARRRRPVHDQHRRPGDVRHRPGPGVRGGGRAGRAAPRTRSRPASPARCATTRHARDWCRYRRDRRSVKAGRSVFDACRIFDKS